MGNHTWLTCGYCGKPVRLKAFFGTLHICLTEEEIAEREHQLRRAHEQVDRRQEWLSQKSLLETILTP